jgi:Peptide-N-glycosidase F, C terminal/Secretion system C-terminal sorting domain
MRTFLQSVVALLLLSSVAKAAPGDTTWVQAHQQAMLSWYGSYDTAVMFPTPGKSYRKIYMIFTLGKYMCGGSGYCGDWDYTVQNYLITPGGKSYEVGRLITPYANAGAPRTPWTWQQHYVYDVTDYAMLLHDSATMRIFYSGYSGGFTANIKFMFIEGQPDREVVGIRKLWDGSYSYGDTSRHGINNINNHFLPVTDTAPEFTTSAQLKFTVTGHGSDPNYCNEFCSHNYYVYLNGSQVDSYTVWRPNCGMNELYPQSGTWLYERANWCPGAIVYSEYHKLPGVYAGSTPSVSLKFDDYVGNGGASYTTSGTVFYYGDLKKELDASIDGIISPNNDENYYRENPVLGTPVIHVMNRGVTAIDSIRFSYGVSGRAGNTYTWIGTLASMAQTDITLPALNSLTNVAGDTGTFAFNVKILSVNGTHDADSTNDHMSSSFAAAPIWPNKLIASMHTNNEYIASNDTICETSWIIYDKNNHIVAQRVNATISKTYNDTFTLAPGYYRFQLYDSSCDGLNWWANNGTSITSGYFYMKKSNGATIAMHGYNYGGTYANDFGCGFSQYFYAASANEGVTNVNAATLSMNAYPNPAQGRVNVDIAGSNPISGTLQIVDELGRTVYQTQSATTHNTISTASFATGVYFVVFTNSGSGERLTSKLEVVR